MLVTMECKFRSANKSHGFTGTSIGLDNLDSCLPVLDIRHFLRVRGAKSKLGIVLKLDLRDLDLR